MSDTVALRMLPPAGLLARLKRAGTDTGSLRLIERHARAYRRAWLIFISGIFEPLFYLLSVGLGLGVLVGKVPGPGGQLIPYREFVAPGLLAVSSMNGAMYDSTFNVFFRLKYAKLYDAVLATPMRPAQVALGEIGWALIRGTIYAIAFTLVMLGIAGSMALVLGIIGIYGVISYAVSQRTREIGIRLALGEQRGRLRWMFVRSALVLTGVGLAIGLTAAAGLMRLMKSLLYGVSPMDPVTYVSVLMVLAASAVLASYLPARRAAAVNPVEALRAE